jgi:hypothetical protein
MSKDIDIYAVFTHVTSPNRAKIQNNSNNNLNSSA